MSRALVTPRFVSGAVNTLPRNRCKSHKASPGGGLGRGGERRAALRRPPHGSPSAGGRGAARGRVPPGGRVRFGGRAEGSGGVPVASWLAAGSAAHSPALHYLAAAAEVSGEEGAAAAACGPALRRRGPGSCRRAPGGVRG